MLVTMRRAEFNSLDDSALGWACIEPTIHQILGRDLTTKTQVYAQLTTGQRALLMFWVLYGHAQNGVAQFYHEVEYLLVQANFWSELKAGLNHFGDDDMLRVVEEMESTYCALVDKHPPAGAVRRGVDASLHYESELLATLRRLDTAFLVIVPTTLERIGTYIRNNPDEFVHVDG